MVRQSIAPLDPFHGGAQQHYALVGPLSDAPRFGVAIIRRHSLGAKVPYEVGGLLIDDVTFGHGSGFNLRPFGKADTVIDEVQAIAIDPAVILWKWLDRRSQRRSMHWEPFRRFLQMHPLPRAQINHALF